MADSFVQLNPDGTGKKIDTRTESTNNENRQVMVIGDPSNNSGVAPVDGTNGLAVYVTTAPASTISGNVTVVQPTGTNLHAVIDSGTVTAAITFPSIGSAVPATGVYNAGLAQTALPAAATAGNLTGVLEDKFGRQVVVLGTLRDLRAGQTTTISASTSETTIVTAGGAGVFNDLIQILVANTSAGTDTRIDFRDATGGSVIFSLQVPSNTTLGFNVPGTSIPQTTAANNWTAQCATSTTDIRIYALYEKNK